MAAGNKIIPVRMEAPMIECIDRLAKRRAKKNKLYEATRAGFIRQAVFEKIQSMDRYLVNANTDSNRCEDCGKSIIDLDCAYYEKDITGSLEIKCVTCARGRAPI